MPSLAFFLLNLFYVFITPFGDTIMCEGVIKMILGVDEFLGKFRDKSDGRELKKRKFLEIKNKKDFSVRINDIDKQVIDESDSIKKRTKEIVNENRVGGEMPYCILNEDDDNFINSQECNQYGKNNENDFDIECTTWGKAINRNKDALNELEQAKKYNIKYAGKKKHM